MTVSVGVGTRPFDPRRGDAGRLLTLADAELYRAERSGGGRVRGATLVGGKTRTRRVSA